jgi:hypothetical protein
MSFFVNSSLVTRLCFVARGKPWLRRDRWVFNELPGDLVKRTTGEESQVKS